MCSLSSRRRRRRSPTLRESFKLVVDFLDQREELEPNIEVAGDPTADVLGRIATLDPRNLLKVDRPQWERIAALEEHPEIVGMSEEKRTVTLYLKGREHVHAIEIDDAAIKAIAPARAGAMFEAFCLRQIKDYSTDQMRLFNVINHGDHFTIDFPDGTRVRVTKADYDRYIAKGQALPGDQPLTQALSAAGDGANVLFAHPLMQKTGTPIKEADAFTFNLQKSYPNFRVYRDPLSKQTGKRVAQLNQFRVQGIRDMVVVIPQAQFKVPLMETIADIKDDLNQLGVKWVPFGGKKPWTGGQGKAVVVVTGHTSEELANFARSMGEAGYLTGNYVVFNSCESPLTRRLLTEITTRYGAIASFCHEGAIPADKVQDFVIGLAKKVKEGGNRRFVDLLMESARESKLSGIWTICRAIRSEGLDLFKEEGSRG